MLGLQMPEMFLEETVGDGDHALVENAASPVLSPPISRIAARRGSNAKKMRSGGVLIRSSFMFGKREPTMVSAGSTQGRPGFFELCNEVVDAVLRTRVEVAVPLSELVSALDLPRHVAAIA